MYMMNDREFSNRKETLHGEFYENALKYPGELRLSMKMRKFLIRCCVYMRCVQQTICGKEE